MPSTFFINVVTVLMVELLDLAPTLFVNVIGRVEAHIPLFGALFTLFTDGSGKLYLFSLLGAGLLLRILGDSLKKKETEAKKDE